MVVTARIDPIDRDIALLIQQEFSPQARSAALATFAKQQLGEAQNINRRALGRVPPHDTFVDGTKTDRVEGVRPDGFISYEFRLITEVIEWVGEQLLKHSPILTGRYSKGHLLFADDQPIQIGAEVPEAKEYVFVNGEPYARKIELGLSNQAPDGVYQVVADLGSQRFGNIARLRFTYRALTGSKDRLDRQPAIVITVG